MSLLLMASGLSVLGALALPPIFALLGWSKPG
jgi:hypothetical protein